MTRGSRENDFQAKQEGCAADDNKFTKAAPSTSSRQWSAFRNPRIVRVSRSFGGKDRHSKVCTVRGLRDRRIRLSVPTAVQLYDLQDRLGLSQPSKVIDWLIDATKSDIDKLPPLVMPQGFGQFHPQQMLLSHEPNSSLVPNFFDANSAFNKDGGFYSRGININSSLDGENHQETVEKYWETAEASLRSGRSNEVGRIAEKGKWIKTNEQENQDGFCNYNTTEQASAQMFFPLTSSSHSSLPGLPNNPLHFNPYYHWDASNLSLSHHFPTHGFQPQAETSLNSNNNTVSMPSSSTSPFSSASQFFLCPPATMPSLFPQCSPYATIPLENESREINHFQLLSSGSQHILPSSRGTSFPKNLSLNVNPGFAHSHQNNNVRQPDEEDNPDS